MGDGWRVVGLFEGPDGWVMGGGWLGDQVGGCWGDGGMEGWQLSVREEIEKEGTSLLNNMRVCLYYTLLLP